MSLNVALSEAAKSESPRVGMSPRGGFSQVSTTDTIRSLSDALRVAKDLSLDEETIKRGVKLIERLEVAHDLMADILATQQDAPIRTQSQYIERAHKLEQTLVRAEAAGVDRSQIQYGKDLIIRCQLEYWVSTLTIRLKGIECAMDANEHDMNKLKAAIQKGQALRASDEVLDVAIALHKRLESELGMSRAVLSLPTSVRLPIENPPEGYWQECDTGKIKETEEYPLPSADSGDYIWISSDTCQLMILAVDKIKSSYVGADLLGANPAVILDAKQKLAKAEKELKILEAKDAADRAIAIEAAQKLAKKLKKAPAKKKA